MKLTKGQPLYLPQPKAAGNPVLTSGDWGVVGLDYPLIQVQFLDKLGQSL